MRTAEPIEELSDPPRDAQGAYLYVMPWDLSVVGGVSQVVENLVIRTARLLHRKPVLLINEWRHFPERTSRERGYDTIWTRVRGPWDRFRPVRGLIAFCVLLPSIVWHLRAMLRAYRVETVCIHYPDTTALTWMIAARMSPKRPSIVLAFHGLDASAAVRSKGLEHWLWKLALRKADYVAACSGSLAATIESGFPNMGRPIRVIDNGVDVAAVMASAAGSTSASVSKRYVMSIGTFEEKKGHDVLMRAFSEIAAAHPDVSLVIAGRTGPEADVRRLEELRAGLVCGDRIVFLKDNPHRETMALLAGAECFILASRSEPFGIVVLEAAILGVPIVVTEICGALARLPAAAPIRKVRVDSERDLVTEVGAVLTDSSVERKHAEAFAAGIRREFDWDNVVRQWGLPGEAPNN